MHWFAWIVVVFAFIEGGRPVYDGGHALVTGEYVTPSSGEYAGQLRPGRRPTATILATISPGR